MYLQLLMIPKKVYIDKAFIDGHHELSTAFKKHNTINTLVAPFINMVEL